MEEELAAEHGNQHCEEEDRMSRETPKWSVDSATYLAARGESGNEGRARIVEQLILFWTCYMKSMVT